MKNTLSSKEQWDGMYKNRATRPYMVNIKTRCSSMELDLIFRKYLPVGNKCNLLEMGCGSSLWLPYFQKIYGFTVTGFDYSKEGCRLAEENLRLSDSHGEIINADFLNPIEKEYVEKFDIAVSFGVVEHFENTTSVLGKIAAYIKTGGYMVTYVPNFSGLIGTFLKKINYDIYKTHKIFSLDDLKTYHLECGLTPLYCSYTEFMDFTVLPIDSLSKYKSLICKNIFYIINKIRMNIYNVSHFRPQSNNLCAAMVIICKK